MASLGEKRTPMAWQHRDMNYHNGGYQERYAQGYELNGIRTGPPSTSDRLSHRTDKSWHTQRDSQAAYPPSRPSYSTGRPPSRPHSSAVTSSTSSSSSESDSENEDPRGPIHLPNFPPQPIYGYEGVYPVYSPSVSHYPGTLKSAKSVPALGTWDGEPCPVHGIGPMSLPGPQPPPIMMPPHHAAFTLPAKKANSIYDMRVLAAPPPPPPSVGAIYGTLPVRPPGVDRRSLAGAPVGIPPQLLPPMARPRPLVVSEGGTTEPLPVRSPPDKTNTLTLGGVANKIADASKDEKHKEKCRGGLCVGMIVMGVVCTGLILGILLVFIL